MIELWFKFTKKKKKIDLNLLLFLKCLYMLSIFIYLFLLGVYWDVNNKNIRHNVSLINKYTQNILWFFGEKKVKSSCFINQEK